MMKELMEKKGEELTVKDSLIITGFCVLGCGVFCAGLVAGAYASKKILNKLDEKKEKNQ